MSDGFQREWHFYLSDMIEFAGKVLTYTKVDNDTLWSIIQDDVPELLPLLEALKTEAVKPGGG